MRDATYKYFMTDVEVYHLESRQPLKFSDVKIAANGPLRASISAEVKYGSSTINVLVRPLYISLER